MRIINQRSDCDSWLSQCQVASIIQVGNQKGWFDDEIAYDLMYQEMVRSQPKIRLTMYDAQNQIRYRACFNLAHLDQQDWSNWTWATISGRHARINPDQRQTVTVTVRTAVLPMKYLDRAEIDIVRLADCAESRR